MTSEEKIAANRRNGRRSRGPRTSAGKARASRNALRHGLSAITHRNPVLFAELEQMANAICSGDENPLLYQQALIIAEKELLLRCVRAELVAVIERLRNGAAIPFTRPSNSAAPLITVALALAKKLSGIRARCGIADAGLYEILSSLKTKQNEIDGAREAMPDLKRLARYERRAWSRRGQAIREFIRIKVTRAIRLVRLVGGTERAPRRKGIPSGKITVEGEGWAFESLSHV
jgi:hypothetical protein